MILVEFFIKNGLFVTVLQELGKYMVHHTKFTLIIYKVPLIILKCQILSLSVKWKKCQLLVKCCPRIQSEWKKHSHTKNKFIVENGNWKYKYPFDFSSENTTALDKFNYQIKQNELYAEHSETIDVLIQEMATRKIVSVGEWVDEWIWIELNCGYSFTPTFLR